MERCKQTSLGDCTSIQADNDVSKTELKHHSDQETIPLIGTSLEPQTMAKKCLSILLSNILNINQKHQTKFEKKQQDKRKDN